MKYTSSRDAGLNECTDAGSDHKLLFDYFLMQLSWSDLILSLHSCSFFSWSSGCNFLIDLLQDWLLSHLDLKLVILLAAVNKEKKINIKRLESFLIQVVMHQKINGSEIGLKAATLVLRPKAETMTLLVE